MPKPTLLTKGWASHRPMTPVQAAGLAPPGRRCPAQRRSDNLKAVVTCHPNALKEAHQLSGMSVTPRGDCLENRTGAGAQQCLSLLVLDVSWFEQWLGALPERASDVVLGILLAPF